VGHCVKHYGADNQHTLNYPWLHTLRTAISNSRVRAFDADHRTFRWKDPDARDWRTGRLPGMEFLRRFLPRVLPQHLHRVRFYYAP